MSALKSDLSLNASYILVTCLTSQSGILPYSLEEHNPSTGFVLKHIEIADAKLLSVICVGGGGLGGGLGGGKGLGGGGLGGGEGGGDGGGGLGGGEGGGEGRQSALHTHVFAWFVVAHVYFVLNAVAPLNIFFWTLVAAVPVQEEMS